MQSSFTVLAVLLPFFTNLVRAQTSATFGDVISLGTSPSDLVLDEARKRLYLINTQANRVDIYDYAGQSVIGSILVGLTPISGALSMDGTFLYVSNHDSSTLSIIDLTSSNPSAAFVSLPAKPQGVEVGADGRVLISTDGNGTAGTSNTLLIYDGRQGTSSQVQPVAFPPPAATPPSLPQLTSRPTTTFNGKLLRTPDGSYIVGVSNFTNGTTASTVVFVYETASGTVLRSRIVVGQSSTMSMSPDGSSFMAGFRLFDIATLNGKAQQSTANALFTSSSFSTTTNVGGSVFSPDGSAIYGAFNTAANTTPTPASQSSTLLISDPHNLAINLAINLPESIVGKMVITSDGTDAWGVSASGVTHLPLGKLYTYPILMPDTTTVFLTQDDCHPGIAQAKLKINNIGGGTLTFAVPLTSLSAALEVNVDSGLAPSTITFTMDPGRSAVVRVPGTNLYTGITPNGTGGVINVTLQSPNAINVPPTIRVYMNYRDSTMRGIIYPVPTTPNSTAAAYEGLQDIVLDQARNLVYITNSGYNRIEVFDTQKRQFLTPIPVGQRPHQMAMGLDGSTLYVANAGGESISIVDLDQQAVVGGIQFPPVPAAGNAAPVSVTSLAMGLTGLEMVMSTNTLWKVVGTAAEPRVGTSITGVAASGAQTALPAPQTMLGSDDGSSILLVAGSGAAYLYNGLTDAYTSARQLFTAPIIGYYGPLGVATGGSFLLSNGLVLNPSLTPIGGAASPGQVTITPPVGPGPGGGGISIGVTSTGLRNVAALAPVGDHAFVRMTTPVRTSLTTTTSDDVHTTLEAVDTNTGATAIAARMPDNPVFYELGTARTPMTARQMVVDSAGTVYAITLSGLSVLPLTPATAATQPVITRAGIVNSTDGSTNYQPGSFITISGTNLASVATAVTLPPPDVLGGSCVLFDQVAIPLLTTSSGSITAQIPATVRPGVNVVQVRSLNMAQQSLPILVTVQKPQ